MNGASFTAVWEFQVKPEAVSAFESIYGPDGAWAQLFRQSPDYRGTELIRDLDRPGRYLTLDHWTSREAFQRLKQDLHVEYAALDKQCEGLTEREVFLGNFRSLPAPEAT
ncbi:MAG: antibiotic biosynthesis monooxygenase family protein [Terriglobales bacterium]